ncbi:hypothetical protein ABPG74_010547 [Tetrahymena malaccensis]
MEERDIDNLFNQIQQIKQQASTLNQSVENSKIQKTKQIRQLSNMESNENNADQFSLMGTLNNSNFFSNNIERTKVKSNNNNYGLNSEIETPSLTPQQSGNLNLSNQQQNSFQQIWSQQLYNSNIPQKSPNQSAFHSKSPSSISTTNRQGSQSIHYTPNQQQMTTPYNNKRQMQQQQGNTQLQNQILNSNSKDKLAKRIEFNNQNDSSIISSLPPHSYSPINASRRLPLMNDQVNIQQNNFLNLHQSQSQQISPHVQQQQQFKGHNQMQLQQNLKMQLQQQQQQQHLQQYSSQPSQQRAKMFNQANMIQNLNQQQPQQQQINQSQNKAAQQKKQLIQQQNQISNQQMRQMPFVQQQQQFQQQLQNQRQNQMSLKQYQEQYNFDMVDPNLISNQHYLSDGILATNEENDYQQEQDTFEDQGYNQEDEIEEQENMYNDFLANSQQNQLSSSYNSKNQDMKNHKKLQYQYYLQQQQQNQPADILRTPQNHQSQFQQYMKTAKNNPSVRSNPHHDYQSLNSFNTPKMSKVPYTSENAFPFNSQIIPNQLANPNPQNNMNQYFFDQGKSEEDYPQLQNNSRQQQSVSARDNSRIRITPNNQDSDSKFAPPRATSNNKNSSIQNFQNQPTKLKKNMQNFQNQYQLLQSPDQDDTEEDFLSNITNQPSPILPQNSNQLNYFPSRDQSFLNLGNTNSQHQQIQQNNNNFIRSKMQRDRSQNHSVSSQMANQNIPFQQTFSQYSQGIQLQPQYHSVGGGSIQDQVPSQKQNSHRVSKYSRQNLDSSIISARKTPSKSQGPRKSPTPVRQAQDQQEEEKITQLKKQLQDSQDLVQKLQDELRSTKEELEDYKYAFQKTVQKFKQVQKHMDQKGAKAQITFYQKSLIKEQSLNKNLKEVNINIKRKILKLRSVVYDQYIKDSEEFLSLQNELRQYELQNEFLRDILQIGSLNDQKCENVNKILEKEEEEINKNQEPPNQEKLIERQRNKRLIERIACEEENLSDENDENYIKRLIKNQKEIEDQKRQEDNSNFNNIFGLILAQAGKPSDMRDEYEDKNMEPNQIQQGNFAIHPVSPSLASSEDKGEIPTNSSLNNSLSSDSSQIQLNTSLNSQLSNDSKKGGINSTSLINSTSVLNSQNKILPPNSPQLNPVSQQAGSTSIIGSSSLLTSTTPSNKLSIGSTSLVSPITAQGSNSNSNPANTNPPKLQTSLRGKSIFSDISSQYGVLGSRTVSPQNRLKSPDPMQRSSSLQQKTTDNSGQSNFSIKKTLEQSQDKLTQQPLKQEDQPKQADLSYETQLKQKQEEKDDNFTNNNNSQDINKNDNSIEQISSNQDAFTFQNGDEDNFNILDENNSDDDGPISEEDILGTNTNSYYQAQNNTFNSKQQEYVNSNSSTKQDNYLSDTVSDQQNKSQGKSLISSSSFLTPSNITTNNPQANQKTNNMPTQSNSIISSSSQLTPQNQVQNSQNQSQKSSIISNQSFFTPTNNSSNAAYINNNTGSNISDTASINNNNTNNKPLIAQSSFISSSSFFSSSGNNFVPYGGATQKKNKDDENVVLLPDYKYEPLKNQYDNQDERQEVQSQNKQQQEQQKEEINFVIPFR